MNPQARYAFAGVVGAWMLAAGGIASVVGALVYTLGGHEPMGLFVVTLATIGLGACLAFLSLHEQVTLAARGPVPAEAEAAPDVHPE